VPPTELADARASLGTGENLYSPALDGGAPVTFEFCGKPEGTFTPNYYPEPACNTASTNAGDYDLSVGGGGINKGFQQSLKLEGENGYQKLHKLLLAAAEKSPGILAAPESGSEAERLARSLGLQACFARLPTYAKGPVSAIFLDILAPEHRPLSERNVAMLYVVGPRGSPGGTDPTIARSGSFLRAVHDLGANAVSAVSEYNGFIRKRPGLPRIDTVQWCLVSGGAYRHPETTKEDVAAATVRGMLQAGRQLRSQPGGAEAMPTVRFAYDNAVFEAAVERLAGSGGGPR